jgi:hypothetical protein
MISNVTIFMINDCLYIILYKKGVIAITINYYSNDENNIRMQY